MNGRLRDAALHGCLVLAAILVLLPFLWIGATSLKTQIAILSGAFAFEPTLDNYQELLAAKASDYPRNFVNSVLVATASTAIVLTIATLGAYSLVRLAWPRWVATLLLAWSAILHLVPPVVLATAWYFMARSTGLYNTHLALVLAHVTLNLPLALWLMHVFIRDVPIELEEAAMVDGASGPTMLLRIVVPLVAPGLVAVGLLSFIFSWNEFTVTLNLAGKQTATAPVGIAKYAQELQIKYGEMAAASVLSLVPALAILLGFQRFIVRGLTAGALK